MVLERISNACCSSCLVVLREQLLDQMFDRSAGLFRLLHSGDDDASALFGLEDLIEFIERLLATFGQLSETATQLLQQLVGLGGVVGLNSGAELGDYFLASFTASVDALSSTSEPGFELRRTTRVRGNMFGPKTMLTFCSSSADNSKPALVFHESTIASVRAWAI